MIALAGTEARGRDSLSMNKKLRGRAAVCQDCYSDIHPDRYFPDRPTHDGVCSRCGSWSWGVVRVSWADIAALSAVGVI